MFLDYDVPGLDGASTFIAEVKDRGKTFFRNTDNHLATMITWFHKREPKSDHKFRRNLFKVQCVNVPGL